MSDRMTVQVSEGIADVRLARPDKLNALDGAMFEALVAVGEKLAADRSLRAVVLSGEGRAFCAGLDVASFMGGGGGARDLFARSGASPANFAQRAAWVWTELPVPVVAAIHGVAFGGGLQIALAADLRIVAPDARLSVMEIKWGLVPDMSGTQTLRRLVRLDVAKELTFTGRIVSGTEAVELGLATQLSEAPRDAAFELAREIAGREPRAVRAAKRLLDASGVIGVEEGLLLEEELQRTLLGKPNQLEAVRANAEKRAPRFQDPE
jgi:enoyl-CoA hydratase/carnithine racemase